MGAATQLAYDVRTVQTAPGILPCDGRVGNAIIFQAIIHGRGPPWRYVRSNVYLTETNTRTDAALVVQEHSISAAAHAVFLRHTTITTYFLLIPPIP